MRFSRPGDLSEVRSLREFSAMSAGGGNRDQSIDGFDQERVSYTESRAAEISVGSVGDQFEELVRSV